MKFKIPFLLMATALLPLSILGCAGSATHTVVSANQSQDSDLSCKSIESELIKTQIIIDGVNQDKEDISGADVIDGILWFPFNLIAKNENYNSALDAADRRIAVLNELKKEKECDIAEKEINVERISLNESDNSNQNNTATDLSSRLRELNQLYKDGILSEAEYIDAKKKLLDQY